MTSHDSMIGMNALTVSIGNSTDTDVLRKHSFFCPYTRNITMSYQGSVRSIIPSYDPYDTPQVLLRPQRMPQGMNIQYVFQVDRQKNTSTTVDFWIQSQYFQNDDIKTYHCYNCQAPSLYYDDNKVVRFQAKSEVHAGDTFDCVNPFCKKKYTYLGMMRIKHV